MSKTNETENLSAWQACNKDFIAEKDKVGEWKEKWITNNSLTSRQRGSILGRYDSVMDGSYGATKAGVKMLGDKEK